MSKNIFEIDSLKTPTKHANGYCWPQKKKKMYQMLDGEKIKMKQNLSYTIATLHQDSIMHVNIMWDLELLELILVAPVFLLDRPCT